MNDNIDKNEIRKAIDRLQAEHPCGIAYDPTAFVSMEAVNTIKECVDKIARRMMEDTEINIICEFAKLYLEGVRPMVMPMVMPKREWIPCSEKLPKESGYYLVQTDGSHNDVIDIAEFGKLWSKKCEDFGWGWNKASRVIAWMPLPEPYQEEGEENEVCN